MENGETKNKKNILNKQKWLWIITIFVFGIAAVFLIYIISDYKNLLFRTLHFSNRAEISQTKEENTQCQDCVRRLIDGVYVKSGKENIPPVAVIIENHVDARPQAGLSKANLVYEAEAEGGITRFLAIFASGDEIEKIGPVRSARPYFVDWAHEFSALFAHCGGSPEALVKISKENIFDLNEYYNEKFFWRDKTIASPHNVFTSSELLNNYLAGKNINEGKFLSWEYKEDETLENSSEENEIIIGFQLSDYVVKWEYDKENNNYTRYTGGQIHKDAEDNEIKAKNVIIEYVKAEVIDEKLRLKMENIGEGKAFVCMDGKCEKGEWRKISAVARTRFYNQNGEEFKLKAGTTWVEIVKSTYSISIK